jgi:hypothetical protein
MLFWVGWSAATFSARPLLHLQPEAESLEKHGVWDPMLEFEYNLTLCPVRVDSNTFSMGNSMPESTLTLYQSRLYPPVRDFGFGQLLVYLFMSRCPTYCT